jgi:hypothetical protein
MIRAVAVAALLALVLAARADAQAEPELRTERPAETAGATVRATGTLVEPPRYDVPPPGRRMAARDVLAVAEANAKVRAARAVHPRAYARAYLVAGGRWQFSLFVPPAHGETARDEVAQVLVDDRDGRVLEAWSGVRVAWPMARGYPGAFGQAVNSPIVWIGLCVLFALPFARPPLRLLHLDLAVLLAFGVSYAFFNAADLGVSVPSAYPLLAYLLARMLLVATRPQPPPRLLVGRSFLVLGIAFLAAFHVALNVANGNVIDVGYASVIGADHMAAGAPLYGAFPPDNPHGDTYGPALYAAYVPFEAAFPWSGTWDDLPAAHAAAIVFDLGCALLLFLLGRRLRDDALGLLLAYLWLAFPFTLMVANSGSNDALVPLLVLGALLAAARPIARGAMAAAAGLTKLAPLFLAPLFLAYRPGRLKAALGFAAIAVLALAPFDLSILYDRTAGFQATRDSPFSIWHDLPPALQTIAQIAAALLAIAVAFVPRNRDVRTLAALAAAVLIALQLAVEHWFYLYLVWFAPLAWVALLTPGAGSARSSPPAAEPTPG